MEENRIDIEENYIYKLDNELLEILLKDRSSKENIIWATDNYAHKGFGYQFSDEITIMAITGHKGGVVKPRTEKSKKEQADRIRDKAEVFTPSWICNKQNNLVDNAWFGTDYVFNEENVKDEDGNIDYTRIAALLKQNKPFNTITMNDEITKGDEKVNFDVVVGNPPYQVSDGGAQASARPIYHNFVYISKKIEPSFMTLIMPTRWYAGGKGLDEFRNDMLNDTSIAELHDFLHPEEVFPNTNNCGGVCYLLWDHKHDKTDSNVRMVSHEGIGAVKTSIRKLRYKDLNILIRNSAAISILNKVIVDETVDTMDHHISPRRPFGLDGNFIKTANFKRETTGMTDPVTCYGKARTVGYVERLNVPTHTEWIDKWKVFMPYANNIGTELNDDNQNTFVVEPKSICTETFLIAGMDLDLDEASATNLSNYLRTRFARFLLSMAKISQHGTSKTYRFVPMQNFSRAWTDADLYAKYSLTEEEIVFIESMIKPME